MSNPVKIAIVGAGFGSKVALPAYSELDELEPVAMWSRRPERAREFAEDGKVELATSDLEELLSFDGLEAVHVATPVVMHVPVAIAAARRGLHVLCEKPLAESLAAAEEIVSAVESAGVVGAVNYGRRFQEARQRVLDRSREVVGTPRMASVSLVYDDHAEPESRSYSWVHDARMGGGRLQGYGVHDLDLLLELFPDVEAVACAADVGVPERPAGEDELRRVTAEDAYAILLRFRGGGLGVVTLIATAHHERADVIELYGDGGTVRLDAERRVWWGRAGEELQCDGPLEASSSDAFKHVARSFASAIRDGTPPEPSLEEGLRVQALFDAVRTADVTRGWVVPAAVPGSSQAP